jgi:hypothetical protein
MYQMRRRPRVDFISAVIAIEKHPDLSLCPNKDERSGIYNICVYRKGVEFIGKLRWPYENVERTAMVRAEVDPAVEELLRGQEVPQ